MKVLRVILIVFGILVAAILIVPIFAPATIVVKAEKEISLAPDQIFPVVASFEGRASWDPWVTQDSTTKVEINSVPGFVGSSYTWIGEKLGVGKMEVISVTENEYIESHLWFGDVEDWSLVEWTFVPTDEGCLVSWSFTEDTKYPFERLGMMFGSVFLKQSFELGLSNLKEVMESNPPAKYVLGPISIQTRPAYEAMLASANGTMDEIGMQLGELYGKIFAAISVQQLEVSGPAFVYYLDYDESTGSSNYQAGIPVKTRGKNEGDVVARHFPEMEVLQAVHTGPYELFEDSYAEIGVYIEEHAIEVDGSALEVYMVMAHNDPDPANWKTIIAFPLK